MISKEYGKFTFICDICGAGTDAEFDTFQEAVDGRHDIGWKSQKSINGWQDVCPDCKRSKRGGENSEE